MRRRIFIAINLPEKIKKELSKFKDQFSDLPAKWVEKENLHITLAFLGYIKDEDLPKIIEITKKVASNYSPFQIKIVKVAFFPPKVFPPRMIWAIGEKNEILFKLQENLKNSLSEINIPQLTEEEKGFIPHITLARIRKWEIRQMEREEIPQIDEDLELEFEANSVDIMESHLKRLGPEYILLQKIPLL
jgi:2'-5' RNA ligase